jgi:transposase
MRTGVTMSKQDLMRIDVISRVVAGQTGAKQAAEIQGVCLRQVRRQIRTFQEKGAEGLIHGNRGRSSSRRIPGAVRQQVRTLMIGEYLDYNTSHLRDELASEHGIQLSYASVYRLRAELGLRSPQRHKVPQHRRRRERAARMGQLVQVDGSDHDWLEGRGPQLSLIAFVDDATGQILGATFREQEDTMGYLLVLDGVCRHWGRPQALYSDQHTIFQSPKEATLEQRLQGEQPLSQSPLRVRQGRGRVLAQLGIAHISARSP